MDTAFSILKTGITVTRALWTIINNVKLVEQDRKELQRQVGALLNILPNPNQVKMYGEHNIVREVERALNNLVLTLEDVGEKLALYDLPATLRTLVSYKGTSDESSLKRLYEKVKKLKDLGVGILTAENRRENFKHIRQKLQTAMSIMLLGFSITHVKQVNSMFDHVSKEFHSLRDTFDYTIDIYTKLEGEPPKGVDAVEARVHEQRLIITWKDKEGDRAQETTRYQVKYHETNCPIITCSETYIALGPKRIQPWQNYEIWVRAVNDFGPSPWYFPPVFCRMNEGPPSSPSILGVEAITPSSLKVFIETPAEEQVVKEIIVEKKVVDKLKAGEVCSDAVWNVEQHFEIQKSTVIGEYVVSGIDKKENYFIRVRCKNKFDVGLPSVEMPIKIEDMHPGSPILETLKVLLSSDGRTFITEVYIKFKPASINPGAVTKYEAMVHEKVSRTSEEPMSKLMFKAWPEEEFTCKLAFDYTKKCEVVVCAIALKGKPAVSRDVAHVELPSAFKGDRFTLNRVTMRYEIKSGLNAGRNAAIFAIPELQNLDISEDRRRLDWRGDKPVLPGLPDDISGDRRDPDWRGDWDRGSVPQVDKVELKFDIGEPKLSMTFFD